MPDVTEVDLGNVASRLRGLAERARQADNHALCADLAELAWELDPEPGPDLPQWRTGTWAEVVTGDRVRLGTAEAEVESAGLTQWLGSGAREVRVKLKDRPKLYVMPPSGQVDILRGPSGQAVDESGVTVTESWPGEQPWDGHRAEMTARNILTRTFRAELIPNA